MVSVSSRIVSEASWVAPSSSVLAAPDLMPFLPLAFSVRLPVPHRVTWEPSLHFSTAFSALSLSALSSLLLAAVSVRVLVVPSAATRVTTEDLPQTMGAVSALVRSRPFKSSVTPLTPALTLTEPSAQRPEST